jgi:hypothetical protein
VSRYWKFLQAGRISPMAGYAWPPAGQWVEAPSARACYRGVHSCRVADLPYWLHDELWEVEYAGPVVEKLFKVIGTRARLVAPVPAWTAESAQEFGLACIARVAGHAGAELTGSGLDGLAARLAAAVPGPPEELARMASELSESAGEPSAARMCGYVADAIEALQYGYPVVMVAFIAARIAAERSGTGSDAAERAWQSHWLATRLRLDPQPAP